MALKKCKECGKDVSTKAKTCPHCGVSKPWESLGDKVIGFISVGLILIGLFWFFGSNESDLTPAEKEAKKAETEREEQVKAEEKRKGIHCLSVWDGSYPALRRAVRSVMRDPDSFKHIETRLTPVNSEGTHTVFMKYRARNGFGGMNVNVASAVMDNETCAGTMLSYGGE